MTAQHAVSKQPSRIIATGPAVCDILRAFLERAQVSACCHGFCRFNWKRGDGINDENLLFVAVAIRLLEHKNHRRLPATPFAIYSGAASNNNNNNNNGGFAPLAESVNIAAGLARAQRPPAALTRNCASAPGPPATGGG